MTDELPPGVNRNTKYRCQWCGQWYHTMVGHPSPDHCEQQRRKQRETRSESDH